MGIPCMYEVRKHHRLSREKEEWRNGQAVATRSLLAGGSVYDDQ